MAFAELGKTGYKLELNSHTIESIQEENIETLPFIDFWLDRVFPNVKDENGKVTEWLTPWCYEIRMDWSHYAVEGRLPNKIYEDSYVTSWGVKDAQTDEYGNITTAAGLEAQGVESGLEKARYIDCANSNKYNITQDIAEAFEVFCQYEYRCDQRGKFIHQYVDENGNIWTGRKVVFYNRAIKTDNPIVIDYKKNLSTIARTCDSSEIYTKLYVTPIESSTMETGYISIADTPINPILDEFILNFDYLYSIGSISQYQLNYVKTYEVETHKLNTELINLAPQIEDLTVRINNLKATKTNAENEKTSAEQTLQQYQTLRDSEVINTPIRKNKDNPMSIIFVEDGDIKKAALRQVGIAPATIVGYSNYSYATRIFDYNDIITVNQLGSTTANDTNYYLVLDEFGYPTYIYTSKNNPGFEVDNSSIIYLELEYSPKNAYVDICNQLEQRIIGKAATVETLEVSINELQTQLDKLELDQQKLLDDKNILNQKLELTLGPALREGYWTPDSYEDPGQARKAELAMVPTAAQSGAVLTFDNVAFEGEELNYYYANVDDVANDNKTYYPYIDISSIYEEWSDKNIENLTLHFLNPECKYTVGKNKIAAGNYFVVYNGLTRYYFNIPNELTEGTVVEILINDASEPYIKIGNTTITTNITELEGATNLTSVFEGIGNYLGERLVYNNAGFIFGFLKENNAITPILVLNNLDIDYARYKKVQYSFNGNDRGVINNNLRINIPPSGAVFCYPRIIIYDSNVNYDSDNLKIIPYTGALTEETQKLEKFYDYTVLIRSGKPHFTLKITKNNNLNKILNYSYHIEYQVSRANEMLYLDAKNVARENSYPKYSYELKVANTPDNVGFYELGQLVFINDYLMGVSAATGYISGITYKLSNPQDDEIEIKNYKTKFEDLFSTITASSEAMKNNQVAYNIAAGSFNADGTIEGSVLQNSILNNNIAMNYSNTNVAIDDVNGIILTNQQPYLNGVYGQVKLIGGGIFLSNAIDGAGARIWNTGITPNGINAAMITAGQLDVNKIRVFAGDNIAFQWNGEGIFAYKQNEETGSVDLNTYVRYSDKGLQFVSGKHTAVDLGWNGLLISTQDGSTQLTGKYGLTIYDGKPKNDEETGLPLNPVVRIGKFEEENQSIDYGMRLYKQDPETEKYHETLITSNKGQLWLKDYIIVGIEETDDAGNINIAGASGVTDGLEGTILDGGDANEDPTIDNIIVYGGDFAGISGEVEATAGKSVRFWAGDSFSNRRIAPFQVWQDGTLIADRAIVRGTIYAEDGEFSGTINASSGTIGGWTINQYSLSSEGITLQAKSDTKNAAIIVGDSSTGKSVTITSDGTLTANGAIINGTINASGGTIGNFEIADINTAIGSINDITANMENVSVEITSSNGNITKTGEDFSTIFIATIKRGGINISEDEYSNFTYDWKCSDDGETWYTLPDSTGDRTVQYSEKHNANRYIICYVTEKEVSDGGDTITE